jgi:hypothetical protein
MPIAEGHVGDTQPEPGDTGTDAPLEAALVVAECLARLHGGEIRFRTHAADGGIFVELHFPLPRREA